MSVVEWSLGLRQRRKNNITYACFHRYKNSNKHWSSTILYCGLLLFFSHDLKTISTIS